MDIVSFVLDVFSTLDLRSEILRLQEAQDSEQNEFASYIFTVVSLGISLGEKFSMLLKNYENHVLPQYEASLQRFSKRR